MKFEIKFGYWPDGEIKYKWPKINGMWLGIQENWLSKGKRYSLYVQKANALHGIDIKFRYGK